MSKEKVERPLRDPDYISKRGVYYWWSPEWIRGTSGSNKSFGRIEAIKENGMVSLHMLSKDGKLSYIWGSIQEEFRRWHEDRRIDLMIIGEDPDEVDDIILSE